MATYEAWQRRKRRKSVVRVDGALAALLSTHHAVEDAASVVRALPPNAEVVVRNLRGVVVVTVPSLRLCVDGLPNDYVEQSVRAWRRPVAVASRIYFRVFGAPCYALTTQHHATTSTDLGQNVFRHDAVVTVRCVDAARAHRAATNLARWWRRRAQDEPWARVAHHASAVGAAVRADGAGGVLFHSQALPPERRTSSPYDRGCAEAFFRGVTLGHERPRAVLMFGFPGSGKNHVLARTGTDDRVVVDVDACLALLPHFWRGVARRAGDDARDDWVLPLRGAARRLADQVLELAIERRAHLVWNGTGRTLDHYDALLARLRAAGYEIELCGVAVGAQRARERMRARARRTKRPVPKAVLVDAMARVPRHFARLAPLADHARIWWNDGSSQSPRSPHLAWDDHHGVLDPDALRRWHDPSPLAATPSPTSDSSSATEVGPTPLTAVTVAPCL